MTDVITEENERNKITEDQHFVPRFYIKKFSDQNGFLQILNLESAKLLKPRPYSGVCYKKFYYAQTTGVKDDVSQQLEDLFSTLENFIASKYNYIYKKIIYYDQILEDEKYVLSLFFSMLWLRGEYMRKQVNKGSEELTKQMFSWMAEDDNFHDHVKDVLEEKGESITDDEIKKIKEDYINKDYSLEFDNTTHINLITHYQEFANLFFAKHWKIYIANGDNKFITSDNPVIEWFPKKTGFWGPSFFERKHYISLSPNVLIEMLCPISGKGLKRRQIKDDKVLEFNILIANHSMYQCFSPRTNELNDLINFRERALNSIIVNHSKRA